MFEVNNLLRDRVAGQEGGYKPLGDSFGREAEAPTSEVRHSAGLEEIYSKDGERRVAEEDARCRNVMLVEADEFRKALLQHVDVV